MAEPNKILELLQRMQYDEFTKDASKVAMNIIRDKECTADNKHKYESFKDDFEMFEFLHVKSFAWSMVFSNAITEISSRLARIEALLKEKDNSTDTNDSDINIGGF